MKKNNSKILKAFSSFSNLNEFVRGSIMVLGVKSFLSSEKRTYNVIAKGPLFYMIKAIKLNHIKIVISNL